MSRLGIIAEYNPFHNGHKYLLDEAMNRTGAESSIALMSGNFLQRGNPALADKYSRAQAAVIGGVDIVFELPVIYATGSAKDFANGAVYILEKSGAVNYLAFGVEDDEIGLFSEIADILVEEPEEYKSNLNRYLEKGLTFPLASEKAIKKILGDQISDIIEKPNNILAISYIASLKRFNSKIMPVLIKRSDTGYHSTKIKDNLCSAKAIRNALINGQDISSLVPPKSMEPYEEFTKKSIPDVSWLSPFLASRIIYDRNLPEEISGFSKVMDMNPELLHRLRKAPLPITYVELIDYLKTKNLTMTRVSRVLLHLILGIINEDRIMAKQNGYADYLNLLALNADSSSVIKEISSNSDLEIISKKSAYNPERELGKRLWQLDKLSTDLYNQMIYQASKIRLKSELSCSVRIIKK
ncbi:MAG: nucleotidyltransferase family protein [Eubacterium sp.]|nr:nucleotidyltransferase family protein [Eubacterium sp.]